jgi:hypothetical protein
MTFSWVTLEIIGWLLVLSGSSLIQMGIQVLLSEQYLLWHLLCNVLVNSRLWRPFIKCHVLLVVVVRLFIIHIYVFIWYSVIITRWWITVFIYLNFLLWLFWYHSHITLYNHLLWILLILYIYLLSLWYYWRNLIFNYHWYSTWLLRNHIGSLSGGHGATFILLLVAVLWIEASRFSLFSNVDYWNRQLS